MDVWLRLTNQITVGNISAVVTIISFMVYGYYKIRKVIAQQHAEFVAYVATLTENQTRRIEECIHKMPGHPESSTSENSFNQANEQPQKQQNENYDKSNNNPS